MRRQLALAGALGVASVLVTGVPAQAASAGTAPAQVQAAKAACWMKVSARIYITKVKGDKKWRNVSWGVGVSDPKLCQGKIITTWLATKSSAKGQWRKAGTPIRFKVYGSKKSYRVDGGYGFPKCGAYVRTEYRIDGTTWAGKPHRTCKGN